MPGALAALAIAGLGLRAAPPPPELEVGPFVVAYATVTALALLVMSCLYFRAFWKGVVGRGVTRGWAVVGVAYVGMLGWLFLAMARRFPELLRDEVRVLGLVLLVVGLVWYLSLDLADLKRPAASERRPEIALQDRAGVIFARFGDRYGESVQNP